MMTLALGVVPLSIGTRTKLTLHSCVESAQLEPSNSNKVIVFFAGAFLNKCFGT